MLQATLRWDRVTRKCRDLAERRHAHYLDLFKSGRWRHYYSAEEFRTELTAAIDLAQRWAAIAPRPDERASRLGAPVAQVIQKAA